MYKHAKIYIKSLLRLPLTNLLSLADKVRREHTGSKFELCSIVNAKSGLCSEDCKFCAQSIRHSTGIARYPLLEKSRILLVARQAKQNRAEKFGIVTSGNRLNSREIDKVAQAISEIKKKVGISVCASLGVLKKQELTILKQAGLSRYHHNIETSPRFYPQIVSTHRYEERIRTLEAAKEIGLQVCSGGIIGMGEDWQDRIDMALLLKKLDVDSVPINLLVPIKGTRLESIKPISCAEAIRTICVFRIILEDKFIKIAAGRESVLKDFQAMAFMAGANGMLIGGYLTIRGREVAEDLALVEELRRVWKQ
jgi:biotin synthase